MDKYIEVLKNCRLFEGIPHQSLSALIGCLNGQIKKYSKNEFVFTEGKKSKTSGILLNGSLQLIEYDYNGNRSILSNIEPLQIFGEAYSFCGENMSMNIEASEDSIVLHIDSLKISSPCQKSCPMHITLINNLVTILANKNINLSQKIQCLSKRTTREKIMNYLISQSQKNNSKEFFIPYNRQQLADYLCVERSAMAYEIGKLQKEGIIETKKSHFKLL